MEQEKPFKTIEVIDNDTKQLCKVACMSCIRGHRTTSCGIPVCRTKIFWTVKRPGRPSNSCTCRFHSSGVCKCVTAIPKCPHKSRKGEKRTSECRCDEQGRFCCLLEPEHWQTLMKLEKPIVQFFPSRDLLEAWQASQIANSAPQTPVPSSYYESAPPQRQGSCCGSTTTQSTPRISRSIAPSPSDATLSPQSHIIVPQFAFGGFGAPFKPGQEPPEMAWNGMTAQQAPPEPEESMSSCCGGSSAYTPPATQDYRYPDQYQQYPTPPATGFDFDRWNQNYQLYQYPNAICQHCGLNGCTCRSCPPLMQNFGTTSWAHSCGRRHARVAPMPTAQAPQQVLQQIPMQNGTTHMQAQDAIPIHNGVAHSQAPPVSQHRHIAEAPLLSNGTLPPMQTILAHTGSPDPPSILGHISPIHIQQHMHPPQMQYSQAQQHLSPHSDHSQSPQPPSSMMHAMHSPLSNYSDHTLLSGTPDPLDYNEFIIPDLERPHHIVDEHMYGG